MICPLRLVLACARFETQKVWSLRFSAAEDANRKKQSHHRLCDATEDVPHCMLGETPRERGTQGIGEGAGRGHADDDQHDSNNQKNHTDNTFYVHGRNILRMPALIK